MKSNILFFNRKTCSGCMLCEMACSVYKTGACSREASHIKVSIHPYLSTPLVSLSLKCDCPDGKEKCLEICNQGALRFVPREKSTLVLTETNWFPCPILQV